MFKTFILVWILLSKPFRILIRLRPRNGPCNNKNISKLRRTVRERQGAQLTPTTLKWSMGAWTKGGIRVIEDWNRIPAKVKRLDKSDTFRAKYRTLRANQMDHAARWESKRIQSGNSWTQYYQKTQVFCTVLFTVASTGGFLSIVWFSQTRVFYSNSCGGGGGGLAIMFVYF